MENMNHFCAGCAGPGATEISDEGLPFHPECLKKWVKHRKFGNRVFLTVAIFGVIVSVVAGIFLAIQ